MLSDEKLMTFYSKRLLSGGDTPFEKSHFIAAIQACGDALYPNKPSPQQRFARALDNDPVAQLYYKAMQRAPGTEVKTDESHGTQDFVRPQHIGEAHARMHSMAVDHAKAKGMSYAGAYSYPINGSWLV